MTARAVERVVHLRELRRFDDAEREARLALAPQEPAAHLRLGAIASERGEKALARRAFEEALRLDPHSAVARHDLALLERDPGRALRGLVEAGGIDPSMPGVLPNVAAVLWRLSYRMRMLLIVSTVLFVGLSGSGAATSTDSTRLAALVVLAVVALVSWSTCRGLPVRTLPVVRAALRGNGSLTATFIILGCCVVVYFAVVISGVAVVAVVAWLLLRALGCLALVARMSHRSSRRRAQRRAKEHR